ncbi:uncharacterized protein LOC120334200 isoform X2 [Styela clava]
MAQQDKKIPVNSEVEKEKEGSEKVRNKIDTHGSLSSDIEGCENQPDAQKYNKIQDYMVWKTRLFPHGGGKVFTAASSQNQIEGQSNVLAVMPLPLGHSTSFGGNHSDKGWCGSKDLDYSTAGQDGLVRNEKVIEETRENSSFIDEDSQKCLNLENALGCIPPVSLGRGDPVTKQQDSMKKVLSVPEVVTNPERAQKPKSVMDNVEKFPNMLRNEPSLSPSTEPDDLLKSLGSRIGTIFNGGDDNTTPMEPGALASRNKLLETKHKLPGIQPKQITPKENFVVNTDRHKEFRTDENEEKIPIQKDPDKEILNHDENIANEALENRIDENGQRNSDLQHHIMEPNKHTEAAHNPNLLTTHDLIDNNKEEFIPNTADSAQHQTDEPDNEDISSNEPNHEFSMVDDRIDSVTQDIVPKTSGNSQLLTTKPDNKNISLCDLKDYTELLMIHDPIENVAEDNISETADIAQQHTKEPDSKDISSNESEHNPDVLQTDNPIDNVAGDHIIDRAEDTIPGATDDLSKPADEFCEERLSDDLPAVEDFVDGMENTPDELPDAVPDDENTNMSNNDESSPQEHMADQFQSPEIKIPAPGKKSKGNSDEEEERISACDATMGSNGGEDQDSSDDDNTDIDESEDEITSLKRLYKKSKDISSDDETVESKAEFIKQKADEKLFTPPTSDVVVQNYQVSHSYPQRLDTFVNSRHVSERIPCDDLARNGYILTGYTAICLGCDTRHSIRDIEGRPSRNIVWHQDNCPFMNMRRPCADCTSTFVDDYGLEYCTQCRQPIRRIRATSDLLAHLPQNLEPPDPSGRTFNSCVICHRDIQYRQNQDVCVVCGGRICRRCVRREERHFH